ncbi:MAG: LacI family DNA-binding transcriptional regulator [Capsulimonadaceae bacterium]|nr:LacI family DNA-binding transcriptional regulator [Capsulimonadaceae bacterium]
MTTIRDVAKVAECSPATVSLVINGSSRPISIATRLRVLKTIRELGYRPTVAEETKISKKTRTIGVLYEAYKTYPESFLYFRPIVDGLFWSVQDQSYSLLYFGRTRWTNVLRSLRQHFDGRCDGLVLVAPLEVTTLISEVKARGIPIAVLGACSDEPEVSSVNVDDEAGARMAIQHLYDKGHRRIAFFAGNSEHETTIGRLKGFNQAIGELGLDSAQCPAFAGDYSWSSGHERARKLAADVPRSKWPSAIFCGGDTVALGALQGFSDAGVVVPDDISMIGFDGLPSTAASEPPLTTISQPLMEMAKQACDLVIAQVEHPGEPVVKIVKKPVIVERQSVRKLEG